MLSIEEDIAYAVRHIGRSLKLFPKEVDTFLKVTVALSFESACDEIQDRLQNRCRLCGLL